MNLDFIFGALRGNEQFTLFEWESQQITCSFSPRYGWMISLVIAENLTLSVRIQMQLTSFYGGWLLPKYYELAEDSMEPKPIL